MKISCVQMDMAFRKPDDNFSKAKELIYKANRNKPDVILLPETWNTGFYPSETVKKFCDNNGERVKLEIGSLANELSVNIVAGSVANIKHERLYNSSYIFNRNGECIESYDKIHLFSPMDEDKYFSAGDRISTFMIDNFKCGIIICYDLRFDKLIGDLSKSKIDCLFVVSQWPRVRINELSSLLIKRAEEYKIFVACANSCGSAKDVIFNVFFVVRRYDNQIGAFLFCLPDCLPCFDSSPLCYIVFG